MPEEEVKTSGLRTLDQQRAAFAWKKVSVLGAGLGDYLSLVRQLPAMVQTNGLGQTLAFLLIQNGAKYRLYEHLQDWLCVEAPYPVYLAPEPAPGQTQEQDLRLIRKLTTGDSLKLRHATLEVQALALWLKRFSEALDGDKPGAKSAQAAPGGS